MVEDVRESLSLSLSLSLSAIHILIRGTIVIITSNSGTIMVASLICSVFFFALLPCLNREFEQSALFLARMLIAGIFQCIFVYTPELFPTNIRATALGMCSSFARIGGMSTPIFAVVLLDANDSIALLCYAVFCILSGVLMFSLPFETLGAPMGVAFKRLLGEKKSGGGYSDLERVDN